MNKLLLKSVREYKKQSILTPIFVLLEVLLEVMIPMEMAKIIDIGIAGGNLPYIIQRGFILVVMAMLALYFGVTAGKTAAIAAAGYAKNLRHDIFYRVQEFSFKNIDHFSTSGLVTRMTTDITNVQMAYMMSLRLLARAPIMVALSWVMTLTINPKIALLFLVVIPVLGGALIFIAKKAHPHFVKVFDEYDILNNSVQENVNASRVVKSFVREDYEIGKFHDISKYVYKLFTKAEGIVAWNSPVMQTVIYIVIILLVAISGRSIVFGTMETGEMTSVIVYAMQIMMSLMMVTFVFVMIMIAEASTDRITSVLTEVPEMFGAETILMNRCVNEEVFDKTVSLINDFKDYFTSHNQVVYENPSPGNKKGGITTLEDKSLGCVQKSGSADVEDVIEIGGSVTRKGLNLLTGPGNDIVAVTNLTASGCHLILFSTGRGTPVGAPVPTVKIATNTNLAKRKPHWIDFNAGEIINGADLTDELFEYVIEVANGKQTNNEKNGYKEISIFKDGVVL